MYLMSTKISREEAVAFAEQFFHIYLEQRDFDAVWDMLAPDISWVGTGEHEVCHNHDDAKRLLNAERDSWDGYFKILEQWYEMVDIGDNHCALFGGMNIKEDGLNTILVEMRSRVSMVIRRCDDGKIRMVHTHYSVPNADQNSDEFVHKQKTVEYNALVEETLESRTRILKQTTKELETLISNIQGGVQVCRINSELTNVYANDAYYELSGYTRDEMKSLFNDSHNAVIAEGWRDDVKSQLERQLADSKQFELSYPIVNKSGDLVWLLDRGSVITDINGQELYQCVLMDVTEREQAMTDMQRLKNYYEYILHAIPSPLVISNNDGDIRFMNNAALELASGPSFETFEDTPFVQFARTLLGLDVDSTNLLMTVRSVDVAVGDREFHVSSTPLVRDIHSMGDVYLFQDETIQRRNHRMLIQKNDELMVSEARYLIAMEQVNICMFEFNIRNMTISYSEAAVHKFDVTRGVHQILDESIELVHNGYRDVLRDAFKRVCDGEPVVQCVVPVYEASGKETMQEITMTTIYDRKGVAIRAVGILMDITDQIQLEVEKQYREALTADSLVTYEINVTKDTVVSWRANDVLKDVDYHSLPFEQLMMDVAKQYILPEDVDRFLQFMSRLNFTNSFNMGASCITHDHRQRRSNDRRDEYAYITTMVNIVRDIGTGDIRAFCQMKDVTDVKEREQRAAEEQMFYEAMTSNAATVYEINVTQDKPLRGHEEWEQLYGIDENLPYSEIYREFAKRFVIGDAQKAFIKLFSRENVLDNFKRGNRELTLEYQRNDGDGNPVWVSCTMHVLEDPATGEVKAFSYIQDINERKLKELELVYRSERDSISGFYNKSTLQSRIERYLQSKAGAGGQHAFVMFDIDNFKSINDNFGHQFGDCVLTEVSDKIRHLFRDEDILGRIGGDEFVILLKNIESPDNAVARANEIREIVKKSYVINGKVYSISASVGIACYEKDGSTFQELYNNADMALYASKKSGKNCVNCYDTSMNQINDMVDLASREGFVDMRSFENNLADCVFKQLNDAPVVSEAIGDVLQLLGKHYGFCNIYVFETSLDMLTIRSTFEWHSENSATLDCGGQQSLQDIGAYDKLFNNRGMLVASPSSTVTEFGVSRLLCSSAAAQTLQFCIRKNGEFTGFIGFDNCGDAAYTMTDLTQLKNISDVLSLFLMSNRLNHQNGLLGGIISTMLDQMDCFAFAAERTTGLICYANNRLLLSCPDAYDVSSLHNAFNGINLPCNCCRFYDAKLESSVPQRYDFHCETTHKTYSITTTPFECDDGQFNLVVIRTI